MTFIDYEKPTIQIYTEQNLVKKFDGCNSMSSYEPCHCTSGQSRVSY